MRFATALSLLTLVAACTAPAPAAPTATVPAAAPPTTVATSTAPAAVTPAASLPTVAPPAMVPEGLSSEQQTAFRDARLLLVEGDYAAAAARWRALLSVPAAAVEARYNLALALALAGQGTAALQALASGAPDPRDRFVQGRALEATSQHVQAMQSLADS